MTQPSDDNRADDLQHEIETIRDGLGGLVSELDHRRHDAFNFRLQMRRHAVPLAVAGVALLGLAAGGVALGIRRSQARQRLPARAARLGQALKRIADHPERQAAPAPNLGLKILAAAAVAAASVLARRLAQGLFKNSEADARR